MSLVEKCKLYFLKEKKKLQNLIQRKSIDIIEKEIILIKKSYKKNNILQKKKSKNKKPTKIEQ